MSAFPLAYLVRHGETAWSLSGQHTGRADIPLTPAGEQAALGLRPRLAAVSVAAIWSSPSQRARRTGELAGFGDRVEVKPDLAEWDYGDYEGLTTREICAERGDWRLFRDGCPGGETASEMAARVDRAIAEVRALDANVLIFSSSHVMRVLAARWLGLPPERGASFVLETASISVLGYEHDLTEPVIRRWNVAGDAIEEASR
ncbi:MAG: histidine phosphatase family protein [Sphingomonadaceae bacterium]|nr:histidine phosphatase family protein [Sphingomonadaceae bacterium]